MTFLRFLGINRAKNVESTLDASNFEQNNNSEEDYQQNLDDEQLDEESLDPIDEELAALFDNETSDEDRANIERKLESNPQLKKRYEEMRNAWEVLDELTVVPSRDLVEGTVNRLNNETQAELKTLKAETHKRRRTRRLIFASLIAVCFFTGLIFGARLFPNPQRQRERDCRVVEHLTQLETIGDFDYLKALKDANVFKVETNDKEKSYEELTQDRAFFRRQKRFESMDQSVQNHWRQLAQKIDKQPDSKELWGTLDAYAEWLLFSTTDVERELLQQRSTTEKLEEVKNRRSFSEKHFSNRARFGAFRPPQANQRPNETVPFPLQGSPQFMREEPPILAFRLALPEELREEDLTPIYRQYEKFCRDKGHSNNRNAQREDILDFLKDTEPQTSFETLSDKAKNYLSSLSEEDRFSTLGLLITLSFWENSERRFQARDQRPFNPRRPNQQMNSEPFSQPTPYGSNRLLTKELANALREAPPNELDSIVSSPAPEARGRLLGLLWGIAPPNEHR